MKAILHRSGERYISKFFGDERTLVMDMVELINKYGHSQWFQVSGGTVNTKLFLRGMGDGCWYDHKQGKAYLHPNHWFHKIKPK